MLAPSGAQARVVGINPGHVAQTLSKPSHQGALTAPDIQSVYCAGPDGTEDQRDVMDVVVPALASSGHKTSTIKPGSTRYSPGRWRCLLDGVDHLVVKVGHTLCEVQAKTDVLEPEAHRVHLIRGAGEAADRPSPVTRNWSRGKVQRDLDRGHPTSVEMVGPGVVAFPPADIRLRTVGGHCTPARARSAA